MRTGWSFKKPKVDPDLPEKDTRVVEFKCGCFEWLVWYLKPPIECFAHNQPVKGYCSIDDYRQSKRVYD